MRQEIKLKLRAFDHRVLDQSVRDIIRTANMTKAEVKGAIPLPRHIERFTVNRSTHVDKKSREQFEIRTHSRILYIEPSPQTIDALIKLNLPSGVEFEIKLTSGAE